MEYLGAWGTLINEKNLKSKSSCQTPSVEWAIFGLLKIFKRGWIIIPKFFNLVKKVTQRSGVSFILWIVIG